MTESEKASVSTKKKAMDFYADRRERLDRFLTRKLPQHSRSRLARHIAEGKVLVDGLPRKPSFQLERGMRVSVLPLEDKPPQTLLPVPVNFEVVYEDNYFLVINKPPGLLVHPSPTSREPTLVQGLLARGAPLSTGEAPYRPGIVHRLDKGTSGLLLVAKKDAVHRALQTALQAGRIRRWYCVWVEGEMKEKTKTIQTYLGRHPKNRMKRAVVPPTAPDARLAITHCEKMKEWHIPHPNRKRTVITQIHCRLQTGRTHQIRVHLAYAGLPVLGDALYGVPFPLLTRPALHSWQLHLEHPISGKPLNFEAPFPSDLQTLCAWLDSNTS